MYNSHNSHSYFQIARLMRFFVLILMLALVFAFIALAGNDEKTPERTAMDASGSHPEFLLGDANIINGEGAPMRAAIGILVKTNA